MMFIGEQGACRMDKVEESRIGKVNSQFNEELQQQIDGTLPKGHIYQIGKPGAILRSAGFPDANIELSATRLAEKVAQRNHQFDIADVRNLPKALQNPIAVFAYGDKAKSENVIVGLNRDGKQFVVGVFFNQKRGGVEVSSVRGIFNKNNTEWLNWISQGKALYLDKEKIQALINQQRTNLADVEYLDLDDVTKIVNSFENPTVEGLNHQDTGGDTGQDARDIPRYHIEAERSEKAGRNVISSNQASSGADTPGL
ncbi:hypothetical protein, partial [Gabonia massiliensis]|uniref:MuF-C-terminal domain-containing protein n=1 Tax=Gabonia massiliensis TaxID=1686296 RepID=UPI00214C0D2F